MQDKWAILQEDNDPSHGTRLSENLAANYKRDNLIPCKTQRRLKDMWQCEINNIV